MADRPDNQNLAALAHWSVHGQPGTSATKRVVVSDWEHKPFQKPVTSAWNVRIPPPSLQKLLYGFCPREMEDKWFIYSEGPDPRGQVLVHFHRSWTGAKYAEVVIETDIISDPGATDGEESTPRISGIIWESDEELVRSQDEGKAKGAVREVCSWIIGFKLPPDEM